MGYLARDHQYMPLDMVSILLSILGAPLRIEQVPDGSSIYILVLGNKKILAWRLKHRSSLTSHQTNHLDKKRDHSFTDLSGH